MFGKLYVLSDAAPCCFSEATLGEFLATLGSSMPCCYAPDSHHRSCFGHWEVLLNVNQVSSSLIGQWISPYF